MPLTGRRGSSDVVDAMLSRSPDGIDAVADLHGDSEQLERLTEHVASGGRGAYAVCATDVEVLAARGVEATNAMGSSRRLRWQPSPAC